MVWVAAVAQFQSLAGNVYVLRPKKPKKQKTKQNISVLSPFGYELVAAAGWVGEFSCSGSVVKFHLWVQTTGTVALLTGAHSVTRSQRVYSTVPIFLGTLQRSSRECTLRHKRSQEI